MTCNRFTALRFATFATVAFATLAAAQTPTQQADTAPQAASSPHQRNTTSTDTKEAPAATQTEPSSASSPHQQNVTEGKATAGKSSAEHDRMMNDCMKKEGQRNSTLSADQVKKTCTDKMAKASTSDTKAQ
ncbi:MAG: hypothetical protein ACJ8MR_13810 [Povalibacter sp.]